MTKVYAIDGVTPVVHPTAFVHPTAVLIGDVIIGPRCYVGPGACLRGDFGRLIMEEGSNLQDTCVVHGFPGSDTVIEVDGHIGHGAVIHGARVGRNALIGMNAVVMDGAPENGGRNIGMRPMEMLLIGMGGCTSFDVVAILKKARQPIVDCVAEIDAERADEIPKVFTKIHVHFVVTGDNLNPAQVERAVKLSAEKYCSASIMLSKSVTITHDFEIKPLTFEA